MGISYVFHRPPRKKKKKNASLEECTDQESCLSLVMKAASQNVVPKKICASEKVKKRETWERLWILDVGGMKFDLHVYMGRCKWVKFV